MKFRILNWIKKSFQIHNAIAAAEAGAHNSRTTRPETNYDHYDVEHVYGKGVDPDTGAPPSIITQMLNSLECETAYTSVGIFRHGGGREEYELTWKKYKKDGDATPIMPLLEDSLMTAMFLKRLLMGIIDGLIPFMLVVQAVADAEEKLKPDEKLDLLPVSVTILKQIPNRHLSIVISVLNYVARFILPNSEKNLMNAKNMARMLSPIFIRVETEPTMLTKTGLGIDVLECLLDHWDEAVAEIGNLSPARNAAVPPPLPPPAPSELTSTNSIQPVEGTSAETLATVSAAQIATPSTKSSPKEPKKKFRLFKSCCRARSDL
ncbi:hypothetical protein HK097_003651 [Rhizophlyctis rosea]|uniref:Rho-GAP domain-containing protein n=1 Tax=Rhizophlyctis rosea TaxID=64517 RepID=A0AAD5SHT5_9FUNG|nr:hypothetical protein HK097_003651 [Rhizophlyctis rosea]